MICFLRAGFSCARPVLPLFDVKQFSFRTGLLGDLYLFDPSKESWTNLSDALGSKPSPRHGHGFTPAYNKLYVHGGATESGVISELSTCFLSERTQLSTFNWNLAESCMLYQLNFLNLVSRFYFHDLEQSI